MTEDSNPDVQDELRGRFKETQDDTQDDPQPSQTDDSEQTESLAESREQVAMYLPNSLKANLEAFYDEIDSRSKLADQGGVQKNREFYDEIITFILEHQSEIADRLNVEMPDDDG